MSKRKSSRVRPYVQKVNSSKVNELDWIDEIEPASAPVKQEKAEKRGTRS